MDYRFVQTTCPYCGCGCQLLLEVLDGKLIGTSPLKTGRMNEGKLCIKGWNAHEFVQHKERLTRPLIKENGSFRETNWDEALTLVASKLLDIKEKYGPHAMGFLTSARTTNEENYLVQKMVRAAIGTNNIDHCARL